MDGCVWVSGGGFALYLLSLYPSATPLDVLDGLAYWFSEEMRLYAGRDSCDGGRLPISAADAAAAAADDWDD